MVKDLDICSLGNGLVDIQYQVGFEDLEKTGFKSGEMALIDVDHQKNLLNLFTDKSHNLCSGGSAANSIIAFAGFGGKAAHKTILGNDEFGTFYSSEFKELGIELCAPIDNNLPTGTCLILITPDAQRTMLTYLGATSLFAPEHLNEDLIARAKWLYIEGYYFSQEHTKNSIFKAIELAKKHDTKIAISFSDNFIISIFYDDLKKAVDQADLLFCNASEGMNYTKTINFEDAISALQDLNKNFAITNGAEGSTILWNEQRYDIPAYPVEAIDTTGAGDMFAGGFLFGILYMHSPKLAGHLGSYASSKIVSQLGARLSGSHKEILEFVQNENK
jgi:sugar/nucleoside kinase (ribokinase family)